MKFFLKLANEGHYGNTYIQEKLWPKPFAILGKPNFHTKIANLARTIFARSICVVEDGPRRVNLLTSVSGTHKKRLKKREGRSYRHPSEKSEHCSAMRESVHHAARACRSAAPCIAVAIRPHPPLLYLSSLVSLLLVSPR